MNILSMKTCFPAARISTLGLVTLLTGGTLAVLTPASAQTKPDYKPSGYPGVIVRSIPAPPPGKAASSAPGQSNPTRRNSRPNPRGGEMAELEDLGPHGGHLTGGIKPPTPSPAKPATKPTPQQAALARQRAALAKRQAALAKRRAALKRLKAARNAR